MGGNQSSYPLDATPAPSPSGRRGNPHGSGGRSFEELSAQFDLLARNHQDTVRECQRLSRELAAVPRGSGGGGGDQAMSELRKAEAANLSIRQARDLLLTRNHELIAELARAEDRIAELALEAEDAETAHAATKSGRDELAAEAEKLRRQALEMRWQVSALTQSEQDRAGEIQELRDAVARLSMEGSSAESAAPAPGPLASEIPDLTRGQDPADKRQTAVLVGQLMSAQRARDAALKTAEEAKKHSHEAIAGRDELRRQLDAALESHKAELASLHARASAPASAPLTEPEPDANHLAQVNSRIDAAIDAKLARGPETGPPDLSAFASAVQRMSSLVKGLEETPSDAAAAAQLDDEFRGFCEIAHAADLAAAHRLATAGRDLTRMLRQSPAKMARSLPTLNGAVDLLILLALSDGRAIPDPAGALVYCVDDDPDNCECIAAALEKHTLATKYAVKPEQGLEELTAMPCDLVILDVNMPGMDGFECCEKLRQLEHHRGTPILFVSGMTSTPERIGPGRRGVEFLAKPYNLTELSLKVLTMILRRQL